MKKILGFPYSYGDNLTPEIARSNRKQAISYSVFISSIWLHNLGSNHSYFTIFNQSQQLTSEIFENSRLTVINRGGYGSSMDNIGKRLSEEYQQYQQDYNTPPVYNRVGIDKFDEEKFDEEKFIKISEDPRANETVYTRVSVDEAQAAIQCEIQGIVKNPQRIEKPDCKQIDLDFKIDGPSPYTHLDIKQPVGSPILEKQKETRREQELENPNKKKSKRQPQDIKGMSFQMGQKIVDQKQRFCNHKNGPKTPKNVLHVVDLRYVPKNEKEIVKEYCLKGAADNGGSTDGIVFLNDD